MSSAMRSPSKAFTALLLTALIAAPAVAPTTSSAAEAPLVVSGYSDDRVDSGWGLFSFCGDDLRAMLSDTSNFGAGGVVERPISLASPGVDAVTPGSLDGVDVFFTGWVETSTYTADERAALLDFVLGGGAVIATTDGTDHNIADLFGLTLTDSNYTSATPVAPASPLINGPFGTVTTITFSGDQGIYTGLGAASVIAEADPSLGPAVALLPPGALGPGSGPVVLVADVDVFSTADENCVDGPGMGAVANSVFVRNVFAYLANLSETPTTTTTSQPVESSTTTTTTGATSVPRATPRFTG